MNNGLIIDANGNKRWYLNGLFHREDGPAIEYANGDTNWLLNGKHHRIDGPACQYSDGIKRWYFHGKLIPVSNLREFQSYIANKAFW